MNISYGVKQFNDKPLIDLTIGVRRIYTIWDLFWIVPLGFFVLGFALFAGYFYWMFPQQLVWLIPSLIIFLFL